MAVCVYAEVLLRNNCHLQLHLVGCRSEDSQMDWLYSVVILKKYHVEIVHAPTVVLMQF